MPRRRHHKPSQGQELLFGQEEGTMTIATKEKKAAKGPKKQTLIDYYHQRFVGRFGFKPTIAGGKDGSNLKRLVDTWGEKEVRDLLDEFFVTTDARVSRSDYSITAFVTLAQHLRLRDTRLDQRTAENLDAAARASGRR